MTGARYIGPKKWVVKVGGHKVMQGQVVVDPVAAGGAEWPKDVTDYFLALGGVIVGPPGVVKYLSRRGDFELVTQSKSGWDVASCENCEWHAPDVCPATGTELRCPSECWEPPSAPDEDPDNDTVDRLVSERQADTKPIEE